MLEEPQEDQPPRRPSALRRAAVATALVSAVVAGGYGVAAAQTDETPTTEAPDDGAARPDGRGCDHAQDGTSDPDSSGSSSDASL